MMLPRDGGIRPAIILRRVDLPQPLDPMTEEKLPFHSVIETSFTATIELRG